MKALSLIILNCLLISNSFTSEEDLKSEGKIVKKVEKITCYHDSSYQVFGEDGSAISETEYVGKVSKSLRTSWKQGNIEFRSSEYVNYFVGTDEIISEGQSIGTIKRTLQENGLIKEESNYKRITIMDNSGSVGLNELITRNVDGVSIFKRVGEKKIYLKHSSNGKSYNGLIEVEREVSPGVKELVQTKSVPFIERQENGDGYIQFNRFKIKCSIEEL